MKRAIGYALIIAGICLGFYLGGWLCFTGGIIDVVEAIRADVLLYNDLGIGMVKVFLAGLAGILSALCLVIPGRVLLD